MSGETAEARVQSVTTLELFFDLVFVFTVTQLTTTLANDVSWTTFGQVCILLALIYWMYDGYAWLTNNVPAGDGRTPVLLLSGMAGYLIMALAIPTAFGGSGFAFGLAYFVVVVVHTFVYARSGTDLSAAAVRGLAPYNLGGGLAVAIGGAIGGTPQTVIWIAVGVFLWVVSPLIIRIQDFEIALAHFVERHGLVVIVAIGESVVAIGIGAAGLAVDASLVICAVLGLFVSSALWWTYFGGDADKDAERALIQIPSRRRGRTAVNAFGCAHLLLLLGVVLVAVGIKKSIGHPGDELKLAYAVLLVGGVSLFLIGHTIFRSLLGLGVSGWRMAAAALVLIAIPVATQVSATAGLLAVAVLFAIVAAFALARTAAERPSHEQVS